MSWDVFLLWGELVPVGLVRMPAPTGVGYINVRRSLCGEQVRK